MLHCLGFQGTGGLSVLVDGFHAAAQLKATAPEAYRVLASTPVPQQYLDGGRALHYCSLHPTIVEDLHTGMITQVR